MARARVLIKFGLPVEVFVNSATLTDHLSPRYFQAGHFGGKGGHFRGTLCHLAAHWAASALKLRVAEATPFNRTNLTVRVPVDARVSLQKGI